MMPYRSDTIPVFAGPSLFKWVAAPPYEHYAPATAGDLLRLLERSPCTVVLIDGVFDTRRSVWHKEILVLMARGFRIIGAASMGALRAAELARFGMIGCGAIFAAYNSDRITADDEVAVCHAPVALGAAPLSVSQVEVRAALVAAVGAGMITIDAARALRQQSAAMHFRDRTWATLAATDGTVGAAGFASWAKAGAPCLKTADAHAALALALALAPDPPRPGPEPPHTGFLVAVAAAVGVGAQLATR